MKMVVLEWCAWQDLNLRPLVPETKSATYSSLVKRSKNIDIVVFSITVLGLICTTSAPVPAHLPAHLFSLSTAYFLCAPKV
jgi:hypothetical protein